MQIDYREIGKRLKEERRILGKSQEQVSEDLNLGDGNSVISRIERAEKASGITNLDKLLVFADYYQISLPYLLFGKELETMGSNKRMEEIKSKEIVHKFRGEGAPCVDKESGIFMASPIPEEQYQEFLNILNLESYTVSRRKTKRYEGVLMGKLDTSYGYLMCCNIPLYTEERGNITLPVKEDSGVPLLCLSEIYAFTGNGKIIGRMTGFMVRMECLWIPEIMEDLWLRLDSNDNLTPEELLFLQEKQFPYPLCEDEEERDNQFIKYVDSLYADDSFENSEMVYLSYDVFVKDEFRKQGVFKSMVEYLHEINDIAAECYTTNVDEWNSIEEKNEQETINKMVAQKTGMEIEEVENDWTFAFTRNPYIPK